MTDGQPILKTSLLDLLYELRDQQMPLILGGGYGLYLKQVHLQDTLNSPTLIAGELWPAPRATEDLDILLGTAVVEAARIAREHFASDESLGSLRLRGHALWDERMALAGFLSALKDLFGPAE